jgi:hypothetical protein
MSRNTISIWAVGLAVTCALPLAAAEPKSAAIVIPPAREILAKLKPGHPRLLASNEDFAKLKQRIPANPTLQKYYARLKEDGDRTLNAAPSKYVIPDGLRLLDTSRRVVNRTYTLAMLYRLNGDKQYLDRAWAELQAAAAFTNWNPRHFLDTAEMTHAFAIGYDWLYDAWTPAQRQTLRTAMLELGFKPALDVYRKNNWWARARHNWNQVCNGGIGIGALALGDELPAECGEILEAALKSIQLPMAEFSPDGAWAEGPGYWNYATTYNVAFLAALDTALGTDYGLAQMPGFAEAGMFPIYMTGPTGRAFNYADAGEGTIRAPHMFWLARKFNRPLYAWYQRDVAYGGALDLLWLDERGQQPTPATNPLDKYFRNSEVVSFRSDWGDKNGLFAGFKAGDNKANHSNLDLGTFVLDALGCRWAVDLGADDYNMPGYFGKQRWTYYRMRAESHNTLVINPDQEAGQIPTAATKITRFQSQPDRAFAIADLTPAYAKDGAKVQRGVAMLNRRQVLIQDEIQTPKPADVWWFMTTPAEIKIEANGKTALLTQGQAQLKAAILSPADASFSELEAKPLPTSPDPSMQRKNARVRKLAVNVKQTSNLRLAILLTPLSEQTTALGKLAVSPLERW